ncbi:iron-sulfur cluster assembly scaffold protein [Halosimplex halobium]|uniref:iron-sulfur cluster assembly scaffold protein n=1 Tax=Halosimplex halobium TaxID=3396618 RepID=UPI003F56BCB5
MDDPTFTISYQEMTCGDEAEFAVQTSSNGRIEQITFDTESCAVSRAVSSILTAHLEGMSLTDVAESESGTMIVDLLDAQFPDLRYDCVLGPEEVIQKGIEQHLEQQETATASD